MVLGLCVLWTVCPEGSLPGHSGFTVWLEAKGNLWYPVERETA